MKKVADLPHGYSLSFPDGKGLRGLDLLAIVRPDGTPAHVSHAPPGCFPSSCICGQIYGAILADLKLMGKEVD